MSKPVTAMSSTVKQRILLAEDDAMLREILQEGLEADGFEVVPAVDGTGALALARGPHRFDAVLLDEEMPGLRGREVVQRLRAEGNRTVVLLVSGHLEIDAAEQAALGVGPVVRKPVSIDALVRIIRASIAAKPRA